MSAKIELLRIISHCKLDYRSGYWKETLFLIQENIYDEDYCQMLLPEAREAEEEIKDSGNFLGKPPAENFHADIELGTIKETGKRFGTTVLSPKNCLITGGAGSGKTVCGLNLCTKIDAATKSTSLIIIEPKNDYKHLKDKLNRPIKIYSPVHGFNVGLNCPENIVAYLWITEISMSLAARLGLINSRTLLTKVIIALLLIINQGLKKEDLDKAETAKHLTWPSLELVLKAIKNKTITNKLSGKDAYSQTLWHAIEGFIQDSGKLFDCSNGFDINKEILSKNYHCIFDVSNIAPHVTHVITDIIIYQIMMKRIAENYKTDNTDVAMLFEEADLLLASDIQNFPGGLSPLEKLHRLGRELGLMSIVSVSGL